MDELCIDFDLERLRLAAKATVLVGKFLSPVNKRRSIRRHFSAERDRTMSGGKAALTRRQVFEFIEQYILVLFIAFL